MRLTDNTIPSKPLPNRTLASGVGRARSSSVCKRVRPWATSGAPGTYHLAVRSRPALPGSVGDAEPLPGELPSGMAGRGVERRHTSPRDRGRHRTRHHPGRRPLTSSSSEVHRCASLRTPRSPAISRTFENAGGCSLRPTGSRTRSRPSATISRAKPPFGRYRDMDRAGPTSGSWPPASAGLTLPDPR